MKPLSLGISRTDYDHDSSVLFIGTWVTFVSFNSTSVDSLMHFLQVQEKLSTGVGDLINYLNVFLTPVPEATTTFQGWFGLLLDGERPFPYTRTVYTPRIHWSIRESQRTNDGVRDTTPERR